MNRIFLVEDNRLILEASAASLRSAGMEVIEFTRSEGLLAEVRNKRPSLIILDILLPDGNGLELARKIKEEFNIPFMFLTARSSESDRVGGLELGAEDYLVKPFSNRELCLRAETILCRHAPEKPVEKTVPEFEIWMNENLELRIDPRIHQGWIAGESLRLTGSEWKILSYLLRKPGEFCSRIKIMTESLGYQYCGSTRTVDTHVKNLRIKLKSVFWIETVRNSGYRFRGVQA